MEIADIQNYPKTERMAGDNNDDIITITMIMTMTTMMITFIDIEAL